MAKVYLKSKKGSIEFDPESDFITEGGTGRVFKGTFFPFQDANQTIDRTSPEEVAIKVLFDDMAHKHVIALTKRTAEIEVNHPNLMRMIDFIEQDGMYHTVSEWLKGKTVEEYLEEKGKFELDYAIEVLQKVLNGLEALHQSTPQIIHRDLTPANIMLCDNGEVKVIDFGISKVNDESRKAKTAIGTFLGNLYYTPPEQIDGFQSMINPSTDMYALGITFYEMLSGVTPFDQPDLDDKHKNASIPAHPSIPPKAFALIQKTTKKRQSERYQNVEELRKSLRKVKSKPKLPPVAKQSKTAIYVVSSLFALSLIGMGVLANQLNTAKKEVRSLSEEKRDLREQIGELESEKYKIESSSKEENNKMKELIEEITQHYPILITDIEFANSKSNSIFYDYGETLYASSLKYLYARIKYNSLLETGKDIKFNIKITEPSGKISTGKTSPNGFSISTTPYISGDYSKELTTELSGWGAASGGSYSGGWHVYEIWYKNKLLASRRFYINH